MFSKIKYPDGQIGAKFEGIMASAERIVKERINSYEDLFYVRSIADVIANNEDTKLWDLFIPCMFGQRSDVRFTNMQSFDLKLITDIINECNFKKVTIFDPHSTVTLGLIKRSQKLSSYDYVRQAVVDIYQIHSVGTSESTANIMLVSPDAGAYKKVFEYGQNTNLPVMAAVKNRDLKGNASLTFTGNVEGYDCLIVDDLCDGGYTFKALGKALRENGARNVYLYVSHGLFTKGFKELSEVIDHIYCTNSIKDLNMRDIGRDEGLIDYITQYKII